MSVGSTESADASDGPAEPPKTPRRRPLLTGLIALGVMACACAVLYNMPLVWLNFHLLRVRPGDVQITPSGDMVKIRNAAGYLLNGRAASLPLLIPYALDEAKNDQGLTWRGLTIATATRTFGVYGRAVLPEATTSRQKRLEVDPALLAVFDAALQSRHRGLVRQANLAGQMLPDVRLLDVFLARLERARRASPRDMIELEEAQQCVEWWAANNGRWARVGAPPGSPLDPDLAAWMKANVSSGMPLPEAIMERLRRWRAKLDAAGLPKQVRWRAGS